MRGGSKDTARRRVEKRRSLLAAVPEERKRRVRFQPLVSLSPSLFLSVARTSKPVGDRRVAINAVELTPGCPFAGKVRLKESRNGRQLPRSELARGRRGREGESARASMSITPAGRASRLYFALFAFAFRLASARASYSSTLMTVLFLTDVFARGAAYNNIETSYSR